MYPSQLNKLIVFLEETYNDLWEMRENRYNDVPINQTCARILAQLPWFLDFLKAERVELGLPVD